MEEKANMTTEKINSKLDKMTPADKYEFLQSLAESRVKNLNEGTARFAKTKHIAGDGMQYLKSRGVIFPNKITDLIDNGE